MNNNTVLTIFGATGDLMTKKIIPSLFDLFVNKQLPEEFKIVGFSRRDFSDEDFRKHIKEILKSHNINLDTGHVHDFLEIINYHRGNFNTLEDFKSLKNYLDPLEKSCSNIFYIAAPPQFYKDILNNMEASKLHFKDSESATCKLLIEKPLGHDLESSKEIEDLISKLYKEPQIFRIDHYLAKEVLLNILTFKFVNKIFRGSWTNEYSEKISVRLLEKLDVGDRGQFYDKTGALRDVGQNHVLQMFALAAMEKPKDSSDEAIRESRAQAIKNLNELSIEEIKANVVRAQYEGYLNTKDVELNSRTETYFKIQTEINEGSLKGVKVELEAGKAMKADRKEVVIIFKDTDFLVEGFQCEIDPNELEPQFTCRDKIIFSLEPNEAIVLELFYKEPGINGLIKKKIFKMPLQEDDSNKKKNDDYKKVLYDAIYGRHALFISHKEQLAAWEFIDPILKAWENGVGELKRYDKGGKP